MATSHSEAVGHGTLTFVGRFVRRPGTVGSIVPSSSHLAAAMIAPLAAVRAPAGRDRKPMTIVELGPGTGAFTGAIVPCLGPEDRFLAVEIDRVFRDLLQRRWPTVDAECASAEFLVTLLRGRRWPPVDHIVSGLPFATLPPETTARIVEAIRSSLGAGATFTTFHYAQSFAAPRAAAFRQRVDRALQSRPTTRFVAMNFPPAVAVTWVNRRRDRTLLHVDDSRH
jgi:phospholipid N-methyltransferase